MRQALIPAFLLVLGSAVLGATVLREPVAWAAQAVSASIISPLDSHGNVAVHEQGTARVTDVGDASFDPLLVSTGLAGGEIGQITQPVPVGKRLIVTWLNLSAINYAGPAAVQCQISIVAPLPGGGTVITNVATLRLLPAEETYIANEHVFIPLEAASQLGVTCPSDASNEAVSAGGYFAPAN
jgi:hypothetical protein